MRTVNIMKKKGELRRKTHFFPLTSPVEFADDSENRRAGLGTISCQSLSDFDSTMWPFVTMPTVVCRCRAALDDTGRQTSVPNMRQRETTSENGRTTLADAGATIRRRVAFW